MTVLVLTRDLMDGPADLVITELNARGIEVHRLDPGAFPEEATVTAYLDDRRPAWLGTWGGQHRGLRLSDVTAVYYRRPEGFRTHPGLSAADARWAYDEARYGIGGLLTSLDCLWVNHPHRNAVADYKPCALATAVRCGLSVPRTLITNSPDAARAFIRTLPGQVAAYKPLGASAPRGADGTVEAVWTSPVAANEITPDVARTAHLFQEWITKAFEVRLTVVGEGMFAAEVHAGSEASRLDFRRDYEALTYRVCPVPELVARGVRALMSAFHLRYAALDFLVNPDGAWHLVDLNPNGQWGFVPELRDPIASALVDLLEGTP